MSGAAVLFQVTRVETIEFTRRVQLVWWDANAGVSLKNNFITRSERCSLADLDCLFQGRADIIQVPVRRLHFPFPEAHFFLLLITGIRGRAFIFCFYSLLAHGLESSLLSACPKRPARLNLSFSWGTVIEEEGAFFFPIGNRFPLFKRETKGGPCPL